MKGPAAGLPRAFFTVAVLALAVQEGCAARVRLSDHLNQSGGSIPGMAVQVTQLHTPLVGPAAVRVWWLSSHGRVMGSARPDTEGQVRLEFPSGEPAYVFCEKEGYYLTGVRREGGRPWGFVFVMKPLPKEIKTLGDIGP
jgi:hypothetical protein